MDNQKSIATKDMLAPAISCERLPLFDRANLRSVRAAFTSATACRFRQAWREQEEPGFLPGVVRIGWLENSLVVFAELMDTDIFNAATKLNPRTWELGDVFEMFLRASESRSYAEFHVTPNNHRLQLCYPNDEAAEWARRTGKLEEFFVSGEAFYSMTWIEPEISRWQVYAEIPAAAVGGTKALLENAKWMFSFGRYDHTRGAGEPVISSTSPHAKLDFHRQHEWDAMIFMNSPAIQNR
jgi:hypothetical protein